MTAVPVRMPKNQHVAAGAGLIVLDLLLSDELDAIPACAGGTCGNILSILAFLGWSAYPIARLGNDAVGDKLREDLRRFGVREDFLAIDPKAATPVIIQQNRRLSNGDVSHRFVWRQCLHCGKYLPPFRPPTKTTAQGLLEHLVREDVFVFDRVAPATVALAEASAAKGAIVMFEPSGIGEGRKFQRALEASHIVKYSRDRIKRLPKLRNGRPWLEIQTEGKRGLRFRLFGKPWMQLEALEVPVVKDTSGAGDWTTAGFIHRFVSLGVDRSSASEGDVVGSLRFGQSIAAISCCYLGARGAMYALSARAMVRQAERLIRGEPVKPSSRFIAPPTTYGTVFCSSCVNSVVTHSESPALVTV